MQSWYVYQYQKGTLNSYPELIHVCINAFLPSVSLNDYYLKKKKTLISLNMDYTTQLNSQGI